MKEETKVVVRPQADGTTEYDIRLPEPDMTQRVQLVVNRGKGEEVHTEEG